MRYRYGDEYVERMKAGRKMTREECIKKEEQLYEAHFGKPMSESLQRGAYWHDSKKSGCKRPAKSNRKRQK